MSKKVGVVLSAAAHSLLRAWAKTHGSRAGEELERILMAFPITKATIKIVRPLRTRGVAISDDVARIKLAEIGAAGGGATLDEVADFILQAGGGNE